MKYEITFPIVGTARIAIEADNEVQAINLALAGGGYIELNEWEIDGTRENAIVKSLSKTRDEPDDDIPPF